MNPTKVAFIGAGAINFGLGNVWDHASRLEKMDVVFVGIADPLLKQAETVLATRRQDSNPNKHKWVDTRIFSSYQKMLKEAHPDCVFIGVPPSVHGSMQNAMELECIKAGTNLFIEKPISCIPPEEMDEFSKQVCDAEKNGTIMSVAYMFRYSKAIREMKLLAETFGAIKLVQARYNAAYTKNSKLFWWDSATCGGPIVEQATHFVDIARYFAGDVMLPSVSGMSIKAHEPAGELGHVPVDEKHLVPNERRIPRVTTAMWKFESGAVGTLTHSVLLHGWNYETQFEIAGDGYYIILKDPYGKNEICFRGPGDEMERKMTVPNDPYFEEIETFIKAVKSKDPSHIASSYADALKTYATTWAIRRAAENNAY